MPLFEELKRRSVFRVAAAYLAGSWLLIQVLETLLPIFDVAETSARVVVVVLAIGFVPALILAWAFEWTSEGIVRDSEGRASVAAAPPARKRLDRVIMIVLAIGIGLFAFDKFVLDPARDAETLDLVAEQARSEALAGSYGDQSIAVLPFVDMSPGGDQEYLSDGIAEELLNLLAKIPELRVVSRSSAFAFKGKDIHIPTVAEQLNVGHILEGSVRQAGNRLRITAQLIDASSDTHLWSETYDRELDDIFAIQDDISAAVVEALRIRLLGEAPRARVTATEVLDMNLEARYLWHRRGDGDMDRARDLWLKVIEEDPANARALAFLSVFYREQWRRQQMPKAEALPLMMSYAERAVRADPEFAEARLRYAGALNHAGKVAEAEAQKQIAYTLAPNSQLVLFYQSIDLEQAGDYDGALALTKRLVELDPLSAIHNNNYGYKLLESGQVDAAVPYLETAIELGQESTYDSLVLARLLQGRFEEAETILPFVPEKADRFLATAMLRYSQGQQEASDMALASAMTTEPWDTELARVYAWRGETDLAFEALEQAVAKGEAWGPLPNSVWLEPLHSDPRWPAFLEKAGF
jgi:TolB-like protein/Tfp pilus assembly protein PilF